MAGIGGAAEAQGGGVAIARPSRRAGAAFSYVRTMLVFAVAWELLSRWTANPILLPSPLAVLEALRELALDGELFHHAGVSLARMFASLAIASALAVPLGFAMGLSRTFDRVVDPTVELLRPISGIAWIPLALFMFGIGNALPMFIMTYAAFFPILLGTVAGVRATDRKYIDVARTMGVPLARIVTRVVAPAALPSVMVALRLGVASAWTAVVAAELIGAPSGVGYAVEWYRELLMTPQVMAFIATIGVLGYLTDRAARLLADRWTAWAPKRSDA